MSQLARDFVSKEAIKFDWQIGNILASSLSGFIAGILVTLIIFYTLFDVALKQ